MKSQKLETRDFLIDLERHRKLLNYQERFSTSVENILHAHIIGTSYTQITSFFF